MAKVAHLIILFYNDEEMLRVLVDGAGTQLVVGFCSRPSLNLGIMTELKLVQFGGRENSNHGNEDGVLTSRCSWCCLTPEMQSRRSVKM